MHERIEPRLPLIQPLVDDPITIDLQRVEQHERRRRLRCGSRGSPANPILQGQHPEYLVKQLTEFKSGKRKNAIMSGMAAPLSEEDMRNVAAFYASKTAKPGFAKNKDTVALGEKIWRGGIAERNVPACAACHGPTGAGIPSAPM